MLENPSYLLFSFDFYRLTRACLSFISATAGGYFFILQSGDERSKALVSFGVLLSQEFITEYQNVEPAN
jgi:hypothetical protein